MNLDKTRQSLTLSTRWMTAHQKAESGQNKTQTKSPQTHN